MLSPTLLADFAASTLWRGPAEDGGVYVNPIIEAIERLERRTGRTTTIPHYLSAALTHFRFGRPFAALALHDAMARYCAETRHAPEYAHDALVKAELAPDLAWRDDLESLGPEAPRAATYRSRLDDSYDFAVLDRCEL